AKRPGKQSRKRKHQVYTEIPVILYHGPHDIRRRNLAPKLTTKFDLSGQKVAPVIVTSEVKCYASEDFQYTLNVKMTIPQIALIKVLNHPYLIHPKVWPGSRIMRIDEEILHSSGKLSILDGLLTRLKARGHRGGSNMIAELSPRTCRWKNSGNCSKGSNIALKFRATEPSLVRFGGLTVEKTMTLTSGSSFRSRINSQVTASTLVEYEPTILMPLLCHSDVPAATTQETSPFSV
ncbi:unnamed protein product, partial [Nesidiocoris tenuis]